jgi:predicted ATPase/DNA-binding CsgD family transcriptional regulator
MDRGYFLQQVEHLHEQGQSIRTIAAALGVNRGRVERAIKISALRRSYRPGHQSESRQASIFVGRQREMDMLRTTLEDALAGQGRLVMLGGEPGIGKTRTAHELATIAVQQGGQVLWGRCYEEHGAPPYWPWVQSIRAYVHESKLPQLRVDMGRGAAAIAEIVPDVQERLPGLKPLPHLEEPDQARFRLFDAITGFLLKAAHRQPVVLILDNLHWADRPSLLLLEFVAREIAAARLLVVGTYRDVELSRQHHLFHTLGELTREPLFRRLLLGGLSREDIDRFMALATGIAPPQAILEAVYRQTEGNPLFITEVVRLLVQEGIFTQEGISKFHMLSGATRGTVPPSSEQDVRVRIPDGVREVIGRRLNRLSERCIQTLTIAAVVGREFRLEELACLVSDSPQEDVLAILEEAEQARIIEGLPGALGHYQFSHALIRETLYDELTAARQMRLHAHIARALEAHYRASLASHVARLAHHFFAAGQMAEAGKAVNYAMQAGARAMAMLAYEEAVRYYEMALQRVERREPGERERHCQLLIALGEAHTKAGEMSQAIEVLRQAAESARQLGSPESLAHAAMSFEEATWRPGLPGGAAVHLLEMALEALGEQDSVLRARVLSSLARALVFAGTQERGMAVGRAAIEMARRIGDTSALLVALKAVLHTAVGPALLHERLAYATEMLHIAQQTQEIEKAIQGYFWRIICLLEIGDIPTVAAEVEALTQLAEELKQPFYQYLALTLRIMRLLLEGKWQAAEQIASQSLMVGRRLRGQDPTGTFGIQMFTIRREQGRLREIEPVLRSFVQRHSLASAWRPGLALLYSELGLEQEARDVFESLAADDFTGIPRDALWASCIAYLAEVCAFLRDAPRAATLCQLLLPYAKRSIMAGGHTACLGSASHYLGLLAATMSRWEEAEAHFQDALGMHIKMGAKPWLVHTRYEYARMLLARHSASVMPSQAPTSREKAASLLYEALLLSRDLGMRALEERVIALQEQRKSRLKKATEYPGHLTQREVAVLQLIAAGKTNHEISAQLCISLRTVATHATHIFNKIVAANRAEAAAYAVRHGLA